MDGSSESPQIPIRAIEQVIDSLKLGQSVPEIVKNLIAGGLTPDAAVTAVSNVHWGIQHRAEFTEVRAGRPEIAKNLIVRGIAPDAAGAVVSRVLKERLEGHPEPEPSEMAEWLHRLLSGVAAGAFIILGYLFGGGLSAGKTLLCVMLPLACIWFPSLMTNEPRILVRWGGWVVLLMIGVWRLRMLLLSLII